jgi:hypothetical protein
MQLATMRLRAGRIARRTDSQDHMDQQTDYSAQWLTKA